MVTTENGANIDFKNAEGEITAQHYAFLVSEPEFDQSSAEFETITSVLGGSGARAIRRD